MSIRDNSGNILPDNCRHGEAGPKSGKCSVPGLFCRVTKRASLGVTVKPDGSGDGAMTGGLFGPNGFAAVILFIVWSLSAFWPGRIASARRMSRLRRHARTLLAIVGIGLLLAAAKIAIATSLWPSGWWPPRNGLEKNIPPIACQ